MSLKDQILAKRTPVVEKVHVEEWDLDVYVKVISAKDRADLLEQSRKDKLNSVLLVAKCVCDETGSVLFGNDDLDALSELSGKTIERLALKAVKINGLTADSLDEAKNG